MKKGGIGGAKTITGLHFEKKVDLLTKLASLPGYEVVNNDVYFKGEYVASTYKKKGLYKHLLEPNDIHYLDFISKQYQPDQAVYVPSTQTLFIIEMKFQKTEGSVDEKLQTADFKRKMYQKLTSKMRLNIEYCFILSDFFDKPKYEDSFQYIREVGCDYFIEELPLSWLGLPQPIVEEGDPIPRDVEATS